MGCRNRLIGYRSRTVNPQTGKRSIVFNVRDGYYDLQVSLPCGSCLGCRLEKSRHMAVRCTHEASMYQQNCFLTLTYAPEHLPGPSLDLSRPVKFMKDLRNQFGSGIRAYGCGEYGEKFLRPHFHICLFNFDFSDKYFIKRSGCYDLFGSRVLGELWPEGFHTIGDLSFESAAYVARYVTKKITGKKLAEGHYEYVESDGEIKSRVPEQPVSVSRMPGIGKPWFDKYWSDVYPSDFVVLRGRQVRPPLYYDRLYSKMDPLGFEEVQRRRVSAAVEFSDENDQERLEDLAYIEALNVQRKLLRSYERET